MENNFFNDILKGNSRGFDLSDYSGVNIGGGKLSFGCKVEGHVVGVMLNEVLVKNCLFKIKIAFKSLKERSVEVFCDKLDNVLSDIEDAIKDSTKTLQAKKSIFTEANKQLSVSVERYLGKKMVHNDYDKINCAEVVSQLGKSGFIEGLDSIFGGNKGVNARMEKRVKEFLVELREQVLLAKKGDIKYFVDAIGKMKEALREKDRGKRIKALVYVHDEITARCVDGCREIDYSILLGDCGGFLSFGEFMCILDEFRGGLMDTISSKKGELRLNFSMLLGVFKRFLYKFNALHFMEEEIMGRLLKGKIDKEVSGMLNDKIKEWVCDAFNSKFSFIRLTESGFFDANKFEMNFNSFKSNVNGGCITSGRFSEGELEEIDRYLNLFKESFSGFLLNIDKIHFVVSIGSRMRYCLDKDNGEDVVAVFNDYVKYWIYGDMGLGSEFTSSGYCDYVDISNFEKVVLEFREALLGKFRELAYTEEQIEKTKDDFILLEERTKVLADQVNKLSFVRFLGEAKVKIESFEEIKRYIVRMSSRVTGRVSGGGEVVLRARKEFFRDLARMVEESKWGDVFMKPLSELVKVMHEKIGGNKSSIVIKEMLRNVFSDVRLDEGCKEVKENMYEVCLENACGLGELAEAAKKGGHEMHEVREAIDTVNAVVQKFSVIVESSEVLAMKK